MNGAGRRRQMLNLEEIVDVFDYQPDTGLLFWKVSGQGRQMGKPIGSLSKGYLNVQFGGRNRRVHHIAWLICYGEWPLGQIDHIDGNRANNRIANLRIVNNQVNHKNMKRFSTNTSGCTGVSWSESRRKWCAYINVGKMVMIGRYASFDEAAKARKEAEAQHNFHQNHGRR